MRYDYSDIKDYLERSPKLSIKALVLGFYIILGIFGIPMIYLIDVKYAGKPFISSYMLIFILITTILTFWGIIIIIKKSKNQLLLFWGVLETSISLLQMKLFYIMLYEVLKVNSKIYFYIALIAYITIIVSSFLWLNHAIKTGYHFSKSGKKNVNYLILSFFTLFGIVVLKIMDSFTSKTMQHIILAACLLLVSYITILLSHGFYKYYLIKRF